MPIQGTIHKDSEHRDDRRDTIGRLLRQLGITTPNLEAMAG